MNFLSIVRVNGGKVKLLDNTERIMVMKPGKVLSRMFSLTILGNNPAKIWQHTKGGYVCLHN